MKPANFLSNADKTVCCHAVQSSEIGINMFDFITQLKESLASCSGCIFSESPWANFAYEDKMYSTFVLFNDAVNLWYSVAAVANEKMHTERWWDDNDKGKLKCLETTLSQRYFVHHKSRMACHAIELIMSHNQDTQLILIHKNLCSHIH